MRRYAVLGPLRVFGEEREIEISARKMEILLAVLLIRANQVVSLSQVMAELWGEAPPRRATASVHVYVSNLRKLLSWPDGDDNPIYTRNPGYMLTMGDDELDLHTFQREVEQGRGHVRERRYEQAARCLRAGLELWRGPAFNEYREGPIVSGFVGWLEESRLECVELLIDAELAMGRHRQLVGQLLALTAEYPLREFFHHRLMLALYRCGRQAEALGVYRAVRSTLDRELGLEPGRQLRDLHGAILTADDDLDIRDVS
ncbi:DNA-binding transcriptional activator of the SARP family [Frankia canadensis]|uniref:DNA-binding transcriptional activator of the SARP family n=1 Tax=Frankia canadensis TaxID=1836972 RepID=A0A2I2KRR6_9ACTN|nr:AfsR/SARP family transcriptional regulator [Frankia canadensis]SNQ48350.1 DNA-binding transcriptional activator of the SARP family [Frankia canadensis]SOU55640.1 DNA-binding transcriptional activator of the SARP family [Frankia canadensis]